MTEPCLTTAELAARWGVKPATIKSHRARGHGVPYITTTGKGRPIGTPRVLYPLAQVLAFEEANNIIPIKP